MAMQTDRSFAETDWRDALYQKTWGSRNFRAKYASYLADSRAIAGFKPVNQSIAYPIVGHRAKGCRFWDVDGNEYVDLAMGFGVQLFGHGAEFIHDAVTDQITRGLFLGPQAELAGPVAQLICDLTRVERVCFCNTGSEAVMTACRVARAYSGRDSIAMFTWSYHGHFDGTLGRPRNVSGAEGTRPLAPGVSPAFVSNLIMLDYGKDSTFEILDRCKDLLAAILVEPVQSLRPNLQPVDFLKRLSLWAKSNSVILILDEVLQGFRIHQGGARAYFGVDCDLVTYGKIVGGGLPIGVLAGRSEIMSVIDGGAWSSTSDFPPRTGRTFFAGTFNKNPLGMAVAHAVLSRLIAEGPSLQSMLNARTNCFCDAINQWLNNKGIDIKVVHFGSMFRFISTKSLDNFYASMIANGVYVWEGRSCFLSTAHNDEDLRQVESVVRDAASKWSSSVAQAIG